MKAELRVQGSVATRHGSVRDVNDDLLEAAECLPWVPAAELEEFSEDEGTVEAVPLVVHGDSAEILGRAFPEGGHHGRQLRGSNLDAAVADEDDLFQGVGALAADAVDPVTVVRERQAEADVAVDEMGDLGGQLFVGLRHGDKEFLGVVVLGMRVAADMRIYRPASLDGQVAVNSQPNLGWEA